MRQKVIALVAVVAVFLMVTGFDTAPRVERIRIQDTENYTVFENMTPAMASKIQAGYALRIITEDLDFYTQQSGTDGEVIEYFLVTGTKGDSVHYYDIDRRKSGEDRADGIFTLTDFRIDSVLGSWKNGEETPFSYRPEDIITVQQDYAYADVNGEKTLAWGNQNDGWETIISQENVTYILLLFRIMRNGEYYTRGMESELQGVWHCRNAFLFDEVTEQLRTMEEVSAFHGEYYNSYTSDYHGDYTLLPEILNTYFPQEAS